MGFFYVWNLKISKRKPLFILLAIGLISAFFIWSNRTNLFPTAEPALPTVITKGNEKENKISLTFNISWGDEKVHDILSILENQEVVSTFFLSGEWAERHPEIVEKIVEHNHEIGMLGYRYKSYLEQEIDQVRRDLYLAKGTFQKLDFDDVHLFRAPSGHLNEEIIDVAKNIGFTIIHWNVNPNDWKNPGTEKIVEDVLNETSNGDIILLHASDSAKQTAKALETILPELKKNFELVTVSELIHEVDTKARMIR